MNFGLPPRTIMKLKLVTSDNAMHRIAVALGLFPKCSDRSMDYSRFSRSHTFILMAMGSITVTQFAVFVAQMSGNDDLPAIRWWYFLSIIPQVMTFVTFGVHFQTVKSVKFTLKVYRVGERWKKKFVVILYSALYLVRCLLMLTAFFWWSYLDWKGRTTCALSVLRSLFDILIFAVLLEMCSKIDTLTAAINKARHLVKFDPDRSMQSGAGVCKALQAVHIMYRSQILVSYLNFFMELIIVMYFNVFNVTTNTNAISIFRRVSNNGTQMLKLMISIVMPINTIERHKQAVDEFYKELFRVVRQSDSLCDDRRLFLYLILKKKVNFTACGFFNLDYSLILAILAAVTSQVVVIVQFSMVKS